MYFLSMTFQMCSISPTVPLSQSKERSGDFKGKGAEMGARGIAGLGYMRRKPSYMAIPGSWCKMHEA